MRAKKKFILGGLVIGAAGKALGDEAGRGIARFVGDKIRESNLGKKLGLEESEEEAGESGGGDITITISKDGSTTTFKKGGKVKKKKKKKRSPMANLDAAEREVYRRGLAAYMSSGNRPKTSQHAWAMARVKSAFGKKEAAKIRAKKKKGKKK
jgi:hypothetical protein